MFLKISPLQIEVIVLNIFDIAGNIIYRFPLFIKTKLESAVFINPQENLPERHTGTNIAIVIGGNRGIEKALELHKKGLIDYFLVSGGTVADTNAAELKKHGIPENRIWIENRSTNTPESIKYSMEILLAEAKNFEFGFIYPIIITDGFNMKRIHALFENVLMKARHASPSGVSIAHSSWASSPFASCEPNTWRYTEYGCATVIKEAFYLLIYRLTGKI